MLVYGNLVKIIVKISWKRAWGSPSVQDIEMGGADQKGEKRWKPWAFGTVIKHSMSGFVWSKPHLPTLFGYKVMINICVVYFLISLFFTLYFCLYLNFTFPDFGLQGKKPHELSRIYTLITSVIPFIFTILVPVTLCSFRRSRPHSGSWVWEDDEWHHW